MNLTRPIIFWIAMLAALLAVVTLLRAVLLPFVAGMVLAYLLDPLANRMERLGINRLLATLAIVLSAVVAIALVMILTLPVIVRELAYFIENFPLYLQRLHTLTTDPGHPWLSKLIGEGLGQAEHSVNELTALASSWLVTFLRSIWTGGRALISILSLGVVTPIVACYLLYDWNRMIAAIDNWIPPARRETVRALAREVDDTIAGFVRGQSTLCLILAVFYAVAQFWSDWTSILIVPAIFFVGQSLADYVLSPYLVGRRVHLNPVWVMFALFAFGYLFGFVGLLIAVPLAAAIGVLMRFALRQYYASPFYAAASVPTRENAGEIP